MEHSAEPFDLTKAEAAAILGIAPRTLRDWTDAGEVACLRTVGGHRRYRRSDVVSLRDRLTVDPATSEGGAA